METQRRRQLDSAAVNHELALLVPSVAFNGPDPGSQSVLQELMHRLPPGIRREFRSYLAGAGLDGQALVERESPRRWLLTAGSPVASGPRPSPHRCEDGGRRRRSMRQ